MSLISERLTWARKKKGLKQTDVQVRTGINNKTLSGYENGVSEPDLNTLKLLSELYEVTIDWLIGKPTIEEVEQAIKERDIEEVLQKYKDVLTFKGQKISDEEIKRMLMVLKWRYEDMEPK